MSSRLEQWKSKGKYFRYKDHAVFYIREGEGTCLLIFHGYPYNSFDFKDVWTALVSKYHVIVPDMLGMGFSDKPADYHYSFEDHADMYTALLQYLNLSEVHILTHDLGNSIVQELIARDLKKQNPFTIKSIAFLNGGLFMDVYKPRLIQRLLSQSPKPVGKLLSRLMSKKSVDKATSEVFGVDTKPSKELLLDFWDILNYNNGKSIAYLIGRLIFDKVHYQNRWIAAMQQTTIPMCFINGPSDPNSGIHMARRYEELIPNPNITLLSKNIGHWPQLEAPEQVLQSYDTFIRMVAEKQ
jgi:pimeloyl-ACP methyl ester carboxylesterase